MKSIGIKILVVAWLVMMSAIAIAYFFENKDLGHDIAFFSIFMTAVGFVVFFVGRFENKDNS